MAENVTHGDPNSPSKRVSAKKPASNAASNASTKSPIAPPADRKFSQYKGVISEGDDFWKVVVNGTVLEGTFDTEDDAAAAFDAAVWKATKGEAPEHAYNFGKPSHLPLATAPPSHLHDAESRRFSSRVPKPTSKRMAEDYAVSEDGQVGTPTISTKAIEDDDDDDEDYHDGEQLRTALAPPKRPLLVARSHDHQPVLSSRTKKPVEIVRHGRVHRTSSRYRGVSWYAARKIWKASIQVNRKKEYIGRYATEEDAARAYNKRALELRGDGAVLNDVPTDTRTTQPPDYYAAPRRGPAEHSRRSTKRKAKKDQRRKHAVAPRLPTHHHTEWPKGAANAATAASLSPGQFPDPANDVRGFGLMKSPVFAQKVSDPGNPGHQMTPGFGMAAPGMFSPLFSGLTPLPQTTMSPGGVFAAAVTSPAPNLMGMLSPALADAFKDDEDHDEDDPGTPGKTKNEPWQ